MAQFSIREVEGMRQVRIEIDQETIRARRGALSTMRGDIALTPRLPALADVFRSMFTSEARIRPYYKGSGSIVLQPSLSGYHLLTVQDGETWVLEPGVYWASEGGVSLGMRRERFWPSLWAGDGGLVWKTTLHNAGLRFSSRNPASFPRNLISGQKRLRVFSGTGKVLVCWTPYWNEHLYRRMTGESIDGALLE